MDRELRSARPCEQFTPCWSSLRSWLRARPMTAARAHRAPAPVARRLVEPEAPRLAEAETPRPAAAETRALAEAETQRLVARERVALLAEAEEAVAFLDGKACPDFLRNRAKCVHYSAPVAALCSSIFHLTSYEPYPFANSVRPFRLPEITPWSGHSMRLRNQAAAGNDVDLAFKTFRFQSYRYIHAGETRP